MCRALSRHERRESRRRALSATSVLSVAAHRLPTARASADVTLRAQPNKQRQRGASQIWFGSVWRRGQQVGRPIVIEGFDELWEIAEQFVQTM